MQIIPLFFVLFSTYFLVPQIKTPINYRAVIEQARKVLRAVGREDASALADLADPEWSVFFNPDLDFRMGNNILTRDIRSVYQSKRKIEWGFADGTGESILLPFREYMGIYLKPLARASVELRDRIESHSNTLNTAGRFFPPSLNEYGFTYVECSLPPTKPWMNDWRALWLVFKEEHGKWYLFAILNDQWSI